MSQDTLERNQNNELDDSLNPANRSASNIETEPGTHDMSEFENDFAPSSTSPIQAGNLRGRANKPKKTADDAGSLKDQEEQAPDRSGFSTADHMNEKLGRGYTGTGSTKSKGLAKLYGSN